MLKDVITKVAVSNHLLEDQLRFLPTMMTNIKAQFSKHEVTVRFLEPSEFETIVIDSNTWKQFINEVVKPT